MEARPQNSHHQLKHFAIRYGISAELGKRIFVAVIGVCYRLCIGGVAWGVLGDVSPCRLTNLSSDDSTQSAVIRSAISRQTTSSGKTKN